jgi:hypothetical protein
MSAVTAIEHVRASEAFKKWKKEHAEAYVTSAFSIAAPDAERVWLVGYYDPSAKKMTSFTADGSATESDGVFTKDERLAELKLEEVQVDESDALKNASDLLKGGANNTVIVLQNYQGNLLWNITFITQSLEVLNVRISAVDGRVIEHTTTKITDFVQRDI